MTNPILSSLNSFGMASGRMPIFLTGMCKEPLNKVPLLKSHAGRANVQGPVGVAQFIHLRLRYHQILW
jgi:hypothetical protein